MNPHLTAFDAEQAERLALLEAQNRQLTADNRRLHRQLLGLKARRQDFEETLVEAFREAIVEWHLEPLPAPAPDLRPRGEEIALYIWADWQLGKQTTSYNFAVAAERIARAVRKGRLLTGLHRSHHPVRKAVVAFIGDIHEGELVFPGQVYELEGGLYEQLAVHGFGIAFKALQQLLLEYGQVEVYCVPGNHGAVGGRARRDHFPTTNVDRLLYRNLANTFAAMGETRIRFTIADTTSPSLWYLVPEIGNYRPLLVHGDIFQSRSGFPFAGAAKLVTGWKAGALPHDFDDVYCFPEGTQVLTEQGLRGIETIQAGERVLTHTGRWQPVMWVLTREAETIQLKGQGHPRLVTTAEHPFWAAEIPKGRGLRRRWADAQYSWQPAAQLVDRFWASPTEFPAMAIPPIEYQDAREQPVPQTKEFFWLVGRWLGDGNLGHNRVVITCMPHEAETIRQHALRLGIDTTITTHPSTLQLLLNRAALVRWLRAQFGEYADGKTVPAWALGMAAEYREALLEGYLSADGCRLQAHQFDACTVSRSLAIGMKLLAQSVGYVVNLHYDAGEQDMVINGHRAHQRDRWRLRGIRDTQRWLAARRQDGLVLGRVKQIEPAGKQLVYNLQVAEDESYLADGLVVHNCGHWHHRIKYEIGTVTLRVSGSPESDNDFARRVLATTSRATQWLGFVDPQRGIVTSEYDLYLEQD